MNSLRQSLRTLRRAPATTALAAITLGIGVGAATTVFALANALFLRPLPHVDVERVVQLRASDGDGPAGWSVPNVEDAMAAASPLEVAAFSDQVVALRGDGDATSTLALVVTPNYFDVLDITPVIGRFFSGEDALPGTTAVVLGHDLWDRAFDGDPAVIGTNVRVNGQVATIVGVAPAGFGGIFTGFTFDLWAPTGMMSVVAPGLDAANRRQGSMEVVARLPEGLGIEAMETVLRNLASYLEASSPAENAGFRIEAKRITGFDDDVRAGALGLTALLLGIASVILAIACANVGCVLLARGLGRRRELAIRAALGANRSRLVRMLLLETATIAAVGGVLGLLLATWSGDLLRLLLPALPVRISLEAPLDLRVFGFVCVVVMLATAASGLAPALRTVAGRADLLRGDGLGAATTSLLWRSFVLVQVSAAITLLATAMLFVRTLARASSDTPGFDVEGVAVRPFLDLGLAGSGDDLVDNQARLLAALESDPGVARAALARSVPLALGGGSLSVQVDGNPTEDRTREVRFNVVSAGYFETIGTSILRGRSFSVDDREGFPDVVIVSEAFVRAYWGDIQPIGRRIVRDDRSLEVIGVAGDAKLSRGETSPQPYLYLPFAQWPGRRTELLLRERYPGAAANALRVAIRNLAPDIPAVDPVPLGSYIAVSILPQRIAAAFAGILGVIGGLLAALGIHGLVAFTVTSRTREIGIRLALGAPPASVAGAVLRQTLGLASVGTVLGLATAVATGRVLGSFLHGLSSTDAATLVAVAGIAVLITLSGAMLPVLRALDIAPSRAMRLD